jgi:pyridoxamine 5'-phosphate oxidase
MGPPWIGEDNAVTIDTPGGTPDPASMRLDYAAAREMAEGDLAPDWASQFSRWFADAVAAGVPEPNAMVLATADVKGRPSARTVLMKGYDQKGFTFYTNYDSRKGAELTANPNASVVFPWIAMHRQVVARGKVSRVDRAETEAYFASRPRGAQLGAWASPQSTVIAGRGYLDEALAEVARRYPDRVPPPPHWGGFRLAPQSVEYWQGRADRLHDRLRYRRTATGWVVERLAP